MKIRLIGNRIMAREVEEQKVKSSIIIIPDKAKSLSQEAIVELVGDGLQFGGDKPVKMYLKPGDKIFFGRNNVKVIKVENEDRLIMSQDNVFGRIE